MHHRRDGRVVEEHAQSDVEGTDAERRARQPHLEVQELPDRQLADRPIAGSVEQVEMQEVGLVRDAERDV